MNNSFIQWDKLQKKRDKPLPIQRAAKYLGVTPKKMKQLEEQGMITPAIDESGKRFYSYGAINYFLENHSDAIRPGKSIVFPDDIKLRFTISFIILTILSTSVGILDHKARNLGFVARVYGINHPDVLGIYYPNKPIKNMVLYLRNMGTYVLEQYKFALSPEKIRDVNEIFELKEGGRVESKLPLN